MKYGSLIVLLLLVGGSILFLSMDRKKPKFSGTKWQCVEKMFVADAGYETTTLTLEFTSSKDVVVSRNTFMPPYPSMRMSPDGTVSREPGWESSDSKKGTYRFKRNILTIKYEDGSEDIFDYRDGKLVGFRRSITGENRVYEMVQE